MIRPFHFTMAFLFPFVINCLTEIFCKAHFYNKEEAERSKALRTGHGINNVSLDIWLVLPSKPCTL